MERVQTLFHKGRNVILIDLSSCQPQETLQILPAAKQEIAKMPAKSALVMTDVRGAKYDRSLVEAFKEFTAHNTPYVKASAVVGAEGAAHILLQTLILITRREMKTFAARGEALEWLTANA